MYSSALHHCIYQVDPMIKVFRDSAFERNCTRNNAIGLCTAGSDFEHAQLVMAAPFGNIVYPDATKVAGCIRWDTIRKG